MTDPGERLRSSLAADQASPAEFDSPIAMEALRATRVLHAAGMTDVEPRAVGAGLGDAATTVVVMTRGTR